MREPHDEPLPDHAGYIAGQRKRSTKDRSHRLLQISAGDVERPRLHVLLPLVGHVENGDVDTNQLGDRRSRRFERGLQRQALRESARDLVQRPQLRRRLPLGSQRVLELAPEQSRLLVQAGAVHGGGELVAQCLEQRSLALVRNSIFRRVESKQADHLACRLQRQGEYRLHARPGKNVAQCLQSLVGEGIRDDHSAREPAGGERQIEQALGDPLVRALKPASGGGAQAVLSVQIHGDALDAEQVGDPLHGGVEHRLHGELRYVLAAEGEKGMSSLQLLGQVAT